MVVREGWEVVFVFKSLFLKIGRKGVRVRGGGGGGVVFFLV